jgi:hypothetical protein
VRKSAVEGFGGGLVQEAAYLPGIGQIGKGQFAEPVILSEAKDLNFEESN